MGGSWRASTEHFYVSGTVLGGQGTRGPTSVLTVVTILFLLLSLSKDQVELGLVNSVIEINKI